MQDVLEYLAGATNVHEDDRQRLQGYVNANTYVRVKADGSHISDEEERRQAVGMYKLHGKPDPESADHLLVHKHHIHRLVGKDRFGNRGDGLIDQQSQVSQLMNEVAALRKRLAEVERNSVSEIPATVNTTAPVQIA